MRLATDDEDVPILSVGSVENGWSPTFREWRSEIYALQDEVEDAVRGVVSASKVNVIFFLFGEYEDPDWRGVRTGSFINRHSLLIVQSAIHSTISHSPSQFLREALRDAITEAESWAEKKRRKEGFEVLRGIVDALLEKHVSDGWSHGGAGKVRRPEG